MLTIDLADPSPLTVMVIDLLLGLQEMMEQIIIGILKAQVLFI